MAKDDRAVAALLPWYEKYKQEVVRESDIGIPEDVVFGPIPYFPYLITAVRSLRLPTHRNMSRRFDNISIILGNRFATGPSTRSGSKVRLRQNAMPSTRRSVRID
jgi:hypothetical protein